MSEHSMRVEQGSVETDAGSSANALAQRALYAIVNLIATLQVVWFYLALVPSYIRYEMYEQGLEKTPFQHRLLMMFPLRWAHQSAWLNHAAATLTSMNAWFPYGVRAEQLVEAPVDILCVIVAGLVARSMYSAASDRGLLTPYVYPLTLVMVTATYSLYTMHRWRFLYDLPSLGFFSAGLYLLYFSKSRIIVALLFMAATINRETTFFLLILYLLKHVSSGSKTDQQTGRGSWKNLLSPAPWLLVIPLSVFWIGWHLWVAKHFAANVSEAWSRVWLNVGVLLWPTSWAQILSVFAFCGPLVVLNGECVRDPTLRLWRWILPIWLLFMLRYGIFLETRIFGELIPYVACMTALIAEQQIVSRMPVPG